MSTNREGLTFKEWLAATTIPIDDNNSGVLTEAWANGEDPTEWRADYEIGNLTFRDGKAYFGRKAGHE